MRIATWNVNSLKARQDAVEKWLARAAPDILLMQETKLGDVDAPVMAFGMAGYQLVHHGEGRWNGVAIALRQGIGADDVITNFGDGPVRDSGPGASVAVSEEDFDPFDEARMMAATVGSRPSGAGIRNSPTAAKRSATHGPEYSSAAASRYGVKSILTRTPPTSSRRTAACSNNAAFSSSPKNVRSLSNGMPKRNLPVVQGDGAGVYGRENSSRGSTPLGNSFTL